MLQLTKPYKEKENQHKRTSNQLMTPERKMLGIAGHRKIDLLKWFFPSILFL